MSVDRRQRRERRADGGSNPCHLVVSLPHSPAEAPWSTCRTRFRSGCPCSYPWPSAGWGLPSCRRRMSCSTLPPPSPRGTEGTSPSFPKTPDASPRRRCTGRGGGCHKTSSSGAPSPWPPRVPQSRSDTARPGRLASSRPRPWLLHPPQTPPRRASPSGVASPLPACFHTG